MHKDVCLATGLGYIDTVKSSAGHADIENTCTAVITSLEDGPCYARSA